MKTAVDYLVEQLMPKALTAEQYYHIEQAKEMEKEQRIKGYQLGYDTGYKVCEMKFNETFKSE
jgi:hypothetical protein